MLLCILITFSASSKRRLVREWSEYSSNLPGFFMLCTPSCNYFIIFVIRINRLRLEFGLISVIYTDSWIHLFMEDCVKSDLHNWSHLSRAPLRLCMKVNHLLVADFVCKPIFSPSTSAMSGPVSWTGGNFIAMFSQTLNEWMNYSCLCFDREFVLEWVPDFCVINMTHVSIYMEFEFAIRTSEKYTVMIILFSIWIFSFKNYSMNNNINFNISNVSQQHFISTSIM